METKGPTVRLVHDFGGPVRVVPIEKRGMTVFVTVGNPETRYPIDLETGYLRGISGKHKMRWRIHPDDFQFFKQDGKQKRPRF